MKGFQKTLEEGMGGTGVEVAALKRRARQGHSHTSRQGHPVILCGICGIGSSLPWCQHRVSVTFLCRKHSCSPAPGNAGTLHPGSHSWDETFRASAEISTAGGGWSRCGVQMAP